MNKKATKPYNSPPNNPTDKQETNIKHEYKLSSLQKTS